MATVGEGEAAGVAQRVRMHTRQAGALGGPGDDVSGSELDKDIRQDGELRTISRRAG